MLNKNISIVDNNKVRKYNSFYRYNVISRLVTFNNKKELYFEFLKKYNGLLKQIKINKSFDLNNFSLSLLNNLINSNNNDYLYNMSSSLFKFNNNYNYLFHYK
jgi:hypothetical protein